VSIANKLEPNLSVEGYRLVASLPGDHNKLEEGLSVSGGFARLIESLVRHSRSRNCTVRSISTRRACAHDLICLRVGFGPWSRLCTIKNRCGLGRQRISRTGRQPHTTRTSGHQRPWDRERLAAAESWTMRRVAAPERAADMWPTGQANRQSCRRCDPWPVGHGGHAQHSTRQVPELGGWLPQLSWLLSTGQSICWGD